MSKTSKTTTAKSSAKKSTKPKKTSAKSVKQTSQKQEKTRNAPATGFHTNPERINRNGRPKHPWSDALRRVLGSKPSGQKQTYMELAAKALAAEAIKGNVKAAKEIGDRVEGKPTQPIDLDLSGGVTLFQIEQKKKQPKAKTALEAKQQAEKSIKSKGL